MTINLDTYSFDGWLDFVFDHPVPETGERAWYWHDGWEWEADANRILENAIRLFKKPTILLNRYSAEQIDQGFWFLLGGTGQICECIWDDEVDVHLRVECVLAMADVFRHLFATHPIQTACYMWWDLLRTFNENPNSKIEEAMLRALKEILSLESPDCQGAALHGLGHLTHPGKKLVIEQYLATHTGLDSETKTYALAAIDGEVQ